MKQLSILILLASFLFVGNANAQLNQLKSKAASIAKGGGLSQDEAGKGIKEALTNGAASAVNLTSKEDGLMGNAAIKIPFPPEAESVGMGKKVDDAILSINRSAEMAAKEAKDILVNAIKQMTVKDAINIVKGDDNAATNYLRKTCTDQLVVKFKPIIEKALDATGATKHWTNVMTSYNKIPMAKKVNPDLSDYTTRKAIEGLLHMIEKEENNIRSNPGARTSELLKKVFG